MAMSITLALLIAACDRAAPSSVERVAGTETPQRAIDDAKRSMRSGDCRLLTIEWHFTSYPGLSGPEIEALERLGSRTYLNVWDRGGIIDEETLQRAGQYTASYNAAVGRLASRHTCSLQPPGG